MSHTYPGRTPWRQKDPARNFAVNVSLSRETWADLWRVATATEKQTAMDLAVANPFTTPDREPAMAVYYCQKPVLLRLVLDDLERSEPVRPSVAWYEVELARRRGVSRMSPGWGQRGGVGMSRAQHDQLVERRGGLTTSEYVYHLIFAELERLGLPITEAPSA